MTPSWLPYNLSLKPGFVQVLPGSVAWISASSGAGALVQLTVVDNPATALSVPLKDGSGFSKLPTTKTTIDGRDAYLSAGQTVTESGPADASGPSQASPGSTTHTIDRSGMGYLMFQPTAGKWLLIGAQNYRNGRPEAADAATLTHIATGLTSAPMAGAAPAAPGK
ncbi:MAG: hypothetical protein QOE97_1660 [Pseudonocardiales bacterium]|jgi:hypothetical protein|nr:hypothetical protein [Pseudonocardiales bacterium]